MYTFSVIVYNILIYCGRITCRRQKIIYLKSNHLKGLSEKLLKDYTNRNSRVLLKQHIYSISTFSGACPIRYVLRITQSILKRLSRNYGDTNLTCKWCIAEDTQGRPRSINFCRLNYSSEHQRVEFEITKSIGQKMIVLLHFIYNLFSFSLCLFGNILRLLSRLMLLYLEKKWGYHYCHFV